MHDENSIHTSNPYNNAFLVFKNSFSSFNVIFFYQGSKNNQFTVMDDQLVKIAQIQSVISISIAALWTPNRNYAKNFSNLSLPQFLNSVF